MLLVPQLLNFFRYKRVIRLYIVQFLNDFIRVCVVLRELRIVQLVRHSRDHSFYFRDLPSDLPLRNDAVLLVLSLSKLYLVPNRAGDLIGIVESLLLRLRYLDIMLYNQLLQLIKLLYSVREAPFLLNSAIKVLQVVHKILYKLH